jgi:DNA-directed RNA polymerase subunit beta'
MGTVTTVGKLLLKHHLPQDLHGFVDTNELDKKNIGSLFDNLTKSKPKEYKDIVSNLTRLGFEVSTRMGSTVKLSDLLSPIDKGARFATLDKQLDEIRKSSKNKKDEEGRVAEAYGKFSDEMNKEIVEVGVKNNQTLAKVVRAGARGSPTQYRQTVLAPIIVSDAKGKVLTDFPVRQSFAEGLSLPEYLAHTFGARQGAVATKLAVAEAGYFSKQLARAAMTTKIEEHDCGTNNGIEVPVEDKDSIGTYLAHPSGGYNKNNEVTSKMLNDLRNKGVKTIVVRSPITCESSKKYHPGAVCQLCAGRREKGGLPPVGDFIGITAATTLGEPLSQGQLNTKHESGSARKTSVSSGFKLINQLANIPDAFKGKAPLAKTDGTVSEVRKAPQGGHYVHIKHGAKEDEYYIPEEFAVKVSQGQHVEAGDVLSEGIINPAEVVKYKGLGEGRRYFATTMKQAFDDGGLGGVSRRNFELIAKGAIDHVKITNNQGLGEYLPGQVVSYHAIEKDYQPRNNSTLTRIDQAIGKYLEQPVLHYTIGTKVTKSMVEALRRNGIESVTVHSKEPDFEPEMQRLLDVPMHENDWMHQLYSTNLERRLIQAVNTGSVSNLKGPSPVAGLAYGVGFGEKKAEESMWAEAEDENIALEDKLSFE